MCEIKKCGCNIPNSPIICMSYKENPNCEDRSLTVSNTSDPTGYSGVTMITPEVNQISAYTEHLEFVNSPEPLSGIKKHTVLRIAQSFIDGITGLISNFIGRNLGTGSKIYKGPKIEGENVIQEFRTLKNSESVEFQEGTDDIIAVVNEEWLQQQFPAIPTVNYPVIDGKNSSNYGTPIYDGLDTDKKIKILPVSSGQINIQKKTTPEGQDYLDFNIPESVDDTIKSFYVNENYTGSGTGNGSILKPYKKLTYALRDIIGTTGSAIEPHYRNSVVNLLSDVIVTKADLDNVPQLKNRLTVNTITIKSDNNYTINFDVENGVDYPFSTTFLKDEAVAANKPGRHSFKLNNIIVYSEKVKGLLKCETFENEIMTVGAIIENSAFNNDYQKDLYQNLYYTTSSTTSDLTFTPTPYPVTLFGNNIRGQVGLISNTTPVVHFLGHNLGNQSNIVISGNFGINSSSQTLLKIENTAFGMDGILSIGLQYYNISLKSLSTKNPVDNFYAVEIVNSYLRIKNVISTYEHVGIGGFDSLFRYYDDGSNSAYSLLVESANFYSTKSNYGFKINSIIRSTNVINLRNSFLGRSIFNESAFYNDRNISEVVGISVQGSEINNVKKSAISGVILGSTSANINGSIFSTLPYAANQADAVIKSLLPNTFYVDGSSNIKMVQNY